MKRKMIVHILEVHSVPVEVEVDDTPNYVGEAIDKAIDMLENDEVNHDFLEYSHTLGAHEWRVFEVE